ncbi:MAG: FUSC family protein [Erythrobacter sp.]
MALPVAEADSRVARLVALLRPFPGRPGQALRLSLIAALTTWLALIWHLPEAGLAAYVAFFMWKPDRVLSVALAMGLMLIAAVLIASVLLLAKGVLDDPMWRVATIAGASFAICWLGSASKLKPVAPIMALVIAYALDLLGANPLPVFTTKALIWAWWLVGAPALVTLGVSLVIAPSPRRLLTRALAERLAAAAATLRGEAGARARLQEARRADPAETARWLKLAAAERSSRPADIAALESAARQSMAICLAAEAADLPPERAHAIAAHLDAMAAILARDLYPVNTALALPGAARLTRQQATAEAALLRAIADFTASAPPPPSVAAKSPFIAADAFTNPAHVHYALKTSGAAMICFLIYHALGWPGIHTAFLTCFIVALPTAAEAAEKITLRLAGAVVGAVLGVAALLLVVPLLENAGQLALLVLVATLPAAWLAVGSERIGYIGFQWAFAFYLVVIQGSGPAYDLAIARDRVLGVLLGNLVTYGMFTRIWPVSIAPGIDAALRGGLAALRRMAGGAAAAARAAALVEAQQHLAAARAGLAIARYEPPGLLPHAGWREERAGLLAACEARLPALQLASASNDSSAAHGIIAQLEEAAASLAPTPSGRPVSGPRHMEALA